MKNAYNALVIAMTITLAASGTTAQANEQSQNVILAKEIEQNIEVLDDKNKRITFSSHELAENTAKITEEYNDSTNKKDKNFLTKKLIHANAKFLVDAAHNMKEMQATMEDLMVDMEELDRSVSSGGNAGLDPHSDIQLKLVDNALTGAGRMLDALQKFDPTDPALADISKRYSNVNANMNAIFERGEEFSLKEQVNFLQQQHAILNTCLQLVETKARRLEILHNKLLVIEIGDAVDGFEFSLRGIQEEFLQGTDGINDMIEMTNRKSPSSRSNQSVKTDLGIRRS